MSSPILNINLILFKGGNIHFEGMFWGGNLYTMTME